MEISTTFKNIIFDFGGVILNIDYKLTEQAFAKLGLCDFEKIHSQQAQEEIFNAFEMGRISPAQFRNEIRKYIGSTTDDQIDTAWNSMLLDLPEERVVLLDKIKKSNRIFLLSNTNQIHFNSFSAYMENKFKRNIFSDVFEKVYVSHEVHMRKPGAEIFELVVKENNLRKSETLFIDDSIQNIEGAKKIGLNTVFLKPGKSILDVFTP